MNMLEISKVSKHFGDRKVLDEVSFSVPENTVFGFAGLNGAGKTTTMKIILGLLKADSGEIRVNGETVRCDRNTTNRYIGYLPDVPEFYSFMTPREYLTFCGEITGMDKSVIKSRTEEMLMLCGLADERHRIKGFSRGMKQRLGIAQALLHEPKLLI
ncbi:MAG: ABC transporter ATP-binding protein, partial [Coprococcus sp.]